MTGQNDPIRAAGVVLMREGPAEPEVALIHRSLRRDWSLPKGKVDPGEHVVAAAVRECDEETGLVPVLGAPLPRQEYLALGQPKVVDYWAARVARDEGFSPDEEVDEVQWVSVDEAAARLTYPRDGDLVRLAVDLPTTTPLILLRHAKAMKRSDFKGFDDAERPLSGFGRTQAKALVPLLQAYGVEAVYSSDATRCRETVRRFAKSIDAEVVEEPALSEEGFADHPKRAVKRLRGLIADPTPLVVCSHRPVLPALVEVIAGMRITGPAALDPALPPGGFLVVHRSFTGGGEPTVVAVEQHLS
ncbi:MAG: NUDIX hydrolase [Actinomycetales bacterium]|nr:NUDIX hydrolase [Actinomycetales bacterium]